MSYGFGLMIEGLVAALLMITICYCSILNNRLRRLKADEQLLKATIAELITATELAERAVSGLKTAARECESALGERLEAAKDCAVALDRQVKAGDGVIERLARVVAASRKLDEVPLPAAEASDPRSVAAAARSLSDRLRERVSAVAA